MLRRARLSLSEQRTAVNFRQLQKLENVSGRPTLRLGGGNEKSVGVFTKIEKAEQKEEQKLTLNKKSMKCNTFVARARDNS